MRHIIRNARNALGAALVLAVLALGGAAASAATTDDERGAELLAAIERGDAVCSDLDAEDHAAIGELAMGRMVASSQAHEAMDRSMAQMMGAGGRDRMHEVMGQSFAGCGQVGLPSAIGQMMGMMGMMGGPGGSGLAGMMGGGYGPDSEADSMMSFDRGSDDDDDLEAWMVVTMLVLVLVVAAAVFFFVRPTTTRSKTRSDPLDLLAERFAHGEISGEEFTERHELLQGGRS